jgi:hypothetical protein
MANLDEESSSKILKFSTASRPDIAEAIKNGTKVIPVEVEDQIKRRAKTCSPQNLTCDE